ncbi:MAG: gamma-glutamyltransferase family protein [Rhodospirillaceae bacterium]|jgi:gamma-glutamyltranspeptidase / glutathione hydrolase|nr:gamma-glutamyltransferase family protein [Rhodospirillaceae bacterium]
MTVYRPDIIGSQYAVSAGHYLAAETGYEILKAGGNAIDAGVAAGLAIGVLQSDIVNIAGVAPTMIWLAEEQKLVNIDGLGVWPAGIDSDHFIKHHGGEIPLGIERTILPAAPASWLKSLELYGTMSFGEVAHSAIRFAAEGFPMYPLMSDYIAENEATYSRWPSNAAIYLPNGRVPRPGELFFQEDLARTLRYMADEEAAKADAGRVAGIRAARDAFYKGDIAKTIADFHRDNGGFLTREDLAAFDVKFEPTVPARFGDIEVHCCGPWSQGPSLAQGLTLIRNAGLDGLEHNSVPYIHRLTEAFKLTFADREAYVGDAAFVDVPLDEMVSDGYAQARATLIDDDRAWPEMPPAGDPRAGKALRDGSATAYPPDDGVPPQHDTSYVSVIDAAGNAFSATPSDVSRHSPIVPGTGLCPSERGSQSWADPAHPAGVTPGKRPRLTPNPAMALKNGRPYLVFGSPGADVQTQAMAQVFLNIAHFGMGVQEALEAPRFATFSFPATFAPHNYFPGRLNLESRFPESVGNSLSAMGHKIEWWPELTWRAGAVCAIKRDDDTDLLHAGADPRRMCYALAW